MLVLQSSKNQLSFINLDENYSKNESIFLLATVFDSMFISTGDFSSDKKISRFHLSENSDLIFPKSDCFVSFEKVTKILFDDVMKKESDERR